jgi:hypothetical protein
VVCRTSLGCVINVTQNPITLQLSNTAHCSASRPPCPCAQGKGGATGPARILACQAREAGAKRIPTVRWVQGP